MTRAFARMSRELACVHNGASQKDCSFMNISMTLLGNHSESSMASSRSAPTCVDCVLAPRKHLRHRCPAIARLQNIVFDAAAPALQPQSARLSRDWLGLVVMMRCTFPPLLLFMAMDLSLCVFETGSVAPMVELCPLKGCDFEPNSKNVCGVCYATCGPLVVRVQIIYFNDPTRLTRSLRLRPRARYEIVLECHRG